MKTSKFLWGWEAYDLQPDTSMTRSRAALLIRAWRRKKEVVLKRVGKGHYQVATRGYDNVCATMIIQIS